MSIAAAWVAAMRNKGNGAACSCPACLSAALDLLLIASDSAECRYTTLGHTRTCQP